MSDKETYSGGKPVAIVVRSEFDESFHHGSVVVLDDHGTVVRAIGDTTSAIFPRSSNKPMQTLAALRAGWKPHRTEDLAIGSASHHGEPMHLEAARRVLDDAGIDETSLQCPPALPGNPDAQRNVLAAGGNEERIYMNCSGKHSMMVAACASLGWDVDQYRGYDEPLQSAIRDTIEDLTGETIAATGIDGCGAPVYAFSLTGLARAFHTLAHADHGTNERDIADAMREHPDLVGGTKSNDSRAMRAIDGLMSKAGAEGVQAFSLPGWGTVAVKIDDGNGRAAMPVALAALQQLGYRGPTNPDQAKEFTDLSEPAIKGGGETVGHVQPII